MSHGLLPPALSAESQPLDAERDQASRKATMGSTRIARRAGT
jgi:hypothetical protein